MGNSITFNVVNSDNKVTNTYTCMLENKSFINSIITVGDNNSIRESDVKKLTDIAQRSGDLGIIEHSDLTGEEKKNLALANNFGEYYDITVSKDGKYLQVKIKDAGFFCKNPNLATIKSDFGIRDGVFVQKDNIPHGNEDVIPESTYGAGYDSVELLVGETINIPVSEININGTPRGGFGRFLSWLTAN